MRQCGGGSRDLQSLRDEAWGRLDAENEALEACMVQGVVGGSGGGLRAARKRSVSVPRIVGAGWGQWGQYVVQATGQARVQRQRFGSGLSAHGRTTATALSC